MMPTKTLRTLNQEWRKAHPLTQEQIAQTYFALLMKYVIKIEIGGQDAC